MVDSKLFNNGYNCAQSVFLPFALELSMDREFALKMMSPFGGGVAHSNNMCGAVSGGIAAIGIHFGHSDSKDVTNKTLCAEKTREFIRKFRNTHGHINCTGLIGYNLANPKERRDANESGVFDEKCTKYVKSASEIVLNIIEQSKN